MTVPLSVTPTDWPSIDPEGPGSSLILGMTENCRQIVMVFRASLDKGGKSGSYWLVIRYPCLSERMRGGP